MKNREVVIVDYGLGNLFSLKRAFDLLGVKSVITRDTGKILEAQGLILPGVGSFEAGISALKEFKLDIVIKEYVKMDKPLLGICLGMQLLMSVSLENGEWEGLDIIKGKVIRFKPCDKGNEKYKIPQIGWNRLIPPKSKNNFGEETILDCFDSCSNKKPYVYFLHSYYVVLENEEYSVAQTYYGQDEFCSVLQNKNINGCQFHPERSGEVGLTILKKFLSLL